MAKLNKLALAALLGILIALSSISPISAGDEESQTDEESKATDDGHSAPPEDNANESGLQSSIDADVSFMFTRPVIEKPYEFPIGKEVHFLVGFKNKGNKNFQINSLGASFRYAQDFKYALQNFSSPVTNKNVEPNQETTIGYTVHINEAYAPRSYGFLVNLLYSDANGVQYENTVFNQTVSLVELDEGFDMESIFLVILLLGLGAIALYAANELYIKHFGISRRQASKPVEYRPVNTKEVDYDWLPNTVGNLKKISNAGKKAPAN